MIVNKSDQIKLAVLLILAILIIISIWCGVRDEFTNRI